MNIGKCSSRGESRAIEYLIVKLVVPHHVITSSVNHQMPSSPLQRIATAQSVIAILAARRIRPAAWRRVIAPDNRSNLSHLSLSFAVATQAYVSGSTGSQCLCCPYGYHIDLDFVRYCEAVAAGSAGDRPSLERRKKRERRRQCQSMEVLLGLVIN